jgi:hypothetical protein
MFIAMSIPIDRIKKVLRAGLDTLFIQTAPLRVSGFDYANEGLKALKQLRVCLVKQETYVDLYTNPTLRGKDLLFSTAHRSGPIGLFHAQTFDFFIVRISASDESTVWRHLKEDMNGPSEHEILAFRDKIIRTASGEVVSSIPQHEVAVSMEKIPWSDYDVVVSINFAVEESVVKKFPKVLWCYMLQEPSMREYVASGKSPLFSYDLFLNQKFTYQVKERKDHEVNFPYNLMHSGSFYELVKDRPVQRRGVFVEIHTAKNITKGQMEKMRAFGDVSYPEEERFENVLTKMSRSKYFFSKRGATLSFKIWGNSMIDAVGAGLLAFGDPKEYHNIGLFTPFTTVNSCEEFIHKIEFLEKKPRKYQRELALQQKLLNKYCFYNPIQTVKNAHRKKQMA